MIKHCVENSDYRGFFRQKLTLETAMDSLGVSFAAEPFIVFNPKNKPQYEIVRQSHHDGTMLFSMQLLEKALSPLFERQSYWKPDGEPTLEQMIKRKYEVGYIKRFGIYCNVKIPVGIYPGVKEVVIIPVRIIE